MTASMPPQDGYPAQEGYPPAPPAGAPGVRIRTAPPVQRRAKGGRGALVWLAALVVGGGLGFLLHRMVPAIAEPFDDWMTQIRR